MSDCEITELESEDYYRGFLQLLEQLTTVNADQITYNDFCKQLYKMKSEVFIIKNEDKTKVIGTASVLIENKFIHKLSSVAHIEDVVVDLKYRGKGLGNLLIEHCIEHAKSEGCYKTILNCGNKNIKFYEKCGFKAKNVEMSLYLN
jgi:glucosamine-phosphate N-acetyltransferase